MTNMTQALAAAVESLDAAEATHYATHNHLTGERPDQDGREVTWLIEATISGRYIVTLATGEHDRIETREAYVGDDPAAAVEAALTEEV